MAALGKIRSKGVALICIIGLGLFAFIAEEGFRSCDSAKNNERQQIGEVLGKKISVQDFQTLVDEYTEVIKMQQGSDNLNDEQLNRVKDMVWNTYVQTAIMEHETDLLGLTVTDAEMQNVLNQGTNPMLTQTPFVNQQTGRFDANALKKFIADYKTQKTTNPQMAAQYEPIYKYWTFIEKNLRQQLLVQKYQSLLAHCLLSNKVEAKMAFKDAREESNVELACFTYASVEDGKIKYNDSELKAKYDELKPRFRQYAESRDIKYIDVKITPSAKDRAELTKQFNEYATELSSADDPSDVVRKSTSQISYLGVPVKKDAYPFDISRKLDSLAVGTTTSVIENKQDNTFNIIKLIAKQQLPDSVEYRQIQVSGKDAADIQQRADSVYNAIKGGADFEALAKRYGQTGEKTWMTTSQYQSTNSMDKDTRNYIMTLNTSASGELKVIPFTQGSIIVQISDRKGMTTKYTAAVIKRAIDFSSETRSKAYNEFSAYISANPKSEDLLKNAKKNGYEVREYKDMTTAAHYVAGIHSTRDAMKWLFEAKEGEISPLYECGDNDHMLVVVLDKIHKKGYRTLKDEQIESLVKAELLKDKKAEQLLAKASGVKSVADAKSKGAVTTTVNQITFAAPAYIPTVGATEPALSGAVAATAKGKFSSKPVKGNYGVYVFKVSEKKNNTTAYDEKSEMQRACQKAMQMAGNFMNELYIKAKVVDNRYLFF